MQVTILLQVKAILSATSFRLKLKFMHSWMMNHRMVLQVLKDRAVYVWHYILWSVELSSCIHQLDRYKAAYESGSDSHLTRDRLYLTWKGLKDADKEENQVTPIMNTSVASVDSVVLESAIALQADDEFYFRHQLL